MTQGQPSSPHSHLLTRPADTVKTQTSSARSCFSHGCLALVVSEMSTPRPAGWKVYDFLWFGSEEEEPALGQTAPPESRCSTASVSAECKASMPRLRGEGDVRSKKPQHAQWTVTAPWGLPGGAAGDGSLAPLGTLTSRSIPPCEVCFPVLRF